MGKIGKTVIHLLLFIIYFGGFSSYTMYILAKLDDTVNNGRTFDEMGGILLIFIGLIAGLILAIGNAVYCIPRMQRKPVLFWVNLSILSIGLIAMLLYL